ncbi:MAG: acetyl-CoA carboxylase carboxyltransferase subunit alpha [Verrucomicrobiota bacterium]
MKASQDIAPLEFEKPITELEKMLSSLNGHSGKHNIDLQDEITDLKKKLVLTKQEIYNNLTPWHRVQIVRHPKRPFTLDYINLISSEFIELHGDRFFMDDRALIGGFATIDKQRMLIIGHQKGRNTKENVMRNFGCAHPEGYRKALRLMKMADKFKIPIVCFIDTPGAYPGVTAEERHIAEAIAVNIREMFTLQVPIIAIVIGEGGSGGALGIGVADRVLIMENSYYSVISPEGCASILWKDRAYAPDAAEALKMNAKELLDMKLVDEVIAEPQGGSHRDWSTASEALKQALLSNLKDLRKGSVKKRLNDRYDRYRNYGQFAESHSPEQ